jgi:deoxyribonuclease V
VKARYLHSWDVTIHQAEEIQRKLASQVITSNKSGEVRLVAGVDISGEYGQGKARGAVVVLSYPELKPVEVKVAEIKPAFVYRPGFLSFRESPVILAALEKLESEPDLIMVDGQGLAHPRRLGIASHLGLLLDRPAIGCAKSILLGTCQPPAAEVGSFSYLEDRGEVIGAALRTRDGAQPVYVSIGHRIDLTGAIAWTLKCCRGYRLPEPTRLAHLAAAGQLKEIELPPPVSAKEKTYQQKLF